MPAQTRNLDDIDRIIEIRVAVDQAFWDALGIRYQEGVSANEIARRVGAAGIASRPTTLARLRPYLSPAQQVNASMEELSATASRAAAALATLIAAWEAAPSSRSDGQTER